MSLALPGVIVLIIVSSPFAGRFAAAFVFASLSEELPLRHRFHCTDCGQPLKGAGLVPFAWLVSPAACRSCRAPIPRLYPALELAFFAAALWASRIEPPQLILPGILLGWISIVLFAFDVIDFVLPDILTYSLLLSGLALAAGQGSGAIVESAAGAFAGGASLLLVKCLYRLVAKRDGLGLGDVKLFAAAGAWVGIEGLPQVLLIASLLGLIFAAVFLRAPWKAMPMEKVPFGAGLCVALWVTWIWSPPLPPA